MNQMDLDALEKKIATSIDAAGWFEDYSEPELVFSALLDVGFRRALGHGGSPHRIAKEFHARLIGLLAEGVHKSRKYRPHLVGGDE